MSAPAHAYLVLRPWSGWRVPWWLRWVGRVLDPEAGHVIAIVPSAGVWVAAEWGPVGIGVYPVASPDVALELFPGRVMRWPLPAELPIQPVEVLSCVSLAKGLCGISNRYIITPRHLWRWCARNGGTVVDGDTLDQ